MATVVLGTQWGDEGRASVVLRFRLVQC